MVMIAFFRFVDGIKATFTTSPSLLAFNISMSNPNELVKQIIDFLLSYDSFLNYLHLFFMLSGSVCNKLIRGRLLRLFLFPYSNFIWLQ